MYENLFPSEDWKDSTPQLKRFFEVRRFAQSKMKAITFEEAAKYADTLKEDRHCSARLRPLWGILDWLRKVNPFNDDKKSEVVIQYIIETMNQGIKEEAKPVLENYRTAWCIHYALQFKMADADLREEVQMHLEELTKEKYAQKYPDIY